MLEWRQNVVRSAFHIESAPKYCKERISYWESMSWLLRGEGKGGGSAREGCVACHDHLSKFMSVVLSEDLIGMIMEYVPPYPYNQSDEAFAYNLKLQNDFFTLLDLKEATMEAKQEANNASYDYCVKLWSRKCEMCQHFHHMLFGGMSENLCWRCVEKKYRHRPNIFISNVLDGCVCCRTLESPYTWRNA